MIVARSNQDGSKHPPFAIMDRTWKGRRQGQDGMGRKDGRVAGIQGKNPTDLVYNNREEKALEQKSMATCPCQCHRRNKGEGFRTAVEPKKRPDARDHCSLRTQYHGATQPQVLFKRSNCRSLRACFNVHKASPVASKRGRPHGSFKHYATFEPVSLAKTA